MKLSYLLITCLYLGLTLASSTEDDSITRSVRSANPAGLKRTLKFLYDNRTINFLTYYIFILIWLIESLT